MGWAADNIVFFNDVYICAKDIIRLIYLDVDMACGLDFFHYGDPKVGPDFLGTSIYLSHISEVQPNCYY